ncbi:ribonuclease inhibitor [Streptosporangium album]|uniref:Ribonuclease inhibitor n=1 Tax=Streptosporangium album TaxID=47479 RepID=A0A7W7S305_9ACTN|nr:barstar family protein [Streptosporangium album]MBB4942722.1 ribonuclease inhibitor [Streptosporangium album]
MELIVDGREIQSESDLHRTLAESLDFGPFYGGNLAALRDRLTTDVPRPISLVWRFSAESRQAMGSELFEKIKDLLVFVEEQDRKIGFKNRFTVRFE